MNKENAENLHNGTLLIHLKNEIMKFTGKWQELEKKIIMSEATLTQKETYGTTNLYVDISF